MRPQMSTAMICLALFSLGCASRSELERVQAQLEECRQDKVAAQEAARASEERYDREVRQWENMETVMAEVLPRTLDEFRREKEEIIQLVPEQARQEVQDYLEGFSDAVSKGFQVLREDNEKILTDLAVTQAQLEQLGVKATSIDERVGRTMQRAFTDRDRMREQAALIVDQIHEFDREYINSKSSPDRLKLNRKEREAISLFHDRLVNALVEMAQPRIEGGAE